MFLDVATEGFIYASFGGNINSKKLPREILQHLVEIFSALSYNVVWKIERLDTYNLTSNIFTSKWLPQQGVLAHPHIKAFICQGGIQNTEEPVHYAVALIGVPFVYDQKFRVNHLQSLGVARKLDIFTSRKDIDNTIRDFLKDTRYKENMLKLRALKKDKLYDSLKNVVWWLEFVTRHKRAPYLRFSGVDESWYQRYDRDVIAFLAIVTFVICCITLIVCLRMALFIFSSFCKLF